MRMRASREGHCQYAPSACRPTRTRTATSSAAGSLGRWISLEGFSRLRWQRVGLPPVAVDAMTFKKPVQVGDVVCAYADLIRVGTTSIAVHVEAWAIRRNETTRQ